MGNVGLDMLSSTLVSWVEDVTGRELGESGVTTAV
jgi:hypothetical protein